MIPQYLVTNQNLHLIQHLMPNQNLHLIQHLMPHPLLMPLLPHLLMSKKSLWSCQGQELNLPLMLQIAVSHLKELLLQLVVVVFCLCEFLFCCCFWGFLFVCLFVCWGRGGGRRLTIVLITFSFISFLPLLPFHLLLSLSFSAGSSSTSTDSNSDSDVHKEL